MLLLSDFVDVVFARPNFGNGDPSLSSGCLRFLALRDRVDGQGLLPGGGEFISSLSPLVSSVIPSLGVRV